MPCRGPKSGAKLARTVIRPTAHRKSAAAGQKFWFGRIGLRRLVEGRGSPIPPYFAPAVPPSVIATSTRTHRAQSRSDRAQSRSASDGYCPHCHLLIERRVGEHWPPQPQRCPHCRLLVGVGRGRPTPSAEPGARGSAAGVFAHEAKRAGGDGDATKEDVRRAIRKVAKDAGQRPERLLMVDYQQLASDNKKLPALSDVFAAYGSWKRARRAAAETK
jgi:hypothetical protein